MILNFFEVSIFQVECIAFEILKHPVSYLELIGTLFGLVSVYLASKAHKATWTTGLINIFFLGLLFYQIQLYADMFLQIFFFLASIRGWIMWNKSSENEQISRLELRIQILMCIILLLSIFGVGKIIMNLNNIFPQYFPKQSTYSYWDAAVMVFSIGATVLLIKRKLENWIFWIITDIISIGLYFIKDTYFLALEYIIFLFLAILGYYRWSLECKRVNDD